jgi:hypothetical protein
VEIDEELAKGRAMPKEITWKKDGVEDRYLYGTAIVHSIHCLYSIMAEYDAIALGLKSVPRDTLHMVGEKLFSFGDEGHCHPCNG